MVLLIDSFMRCFAPPLFIIGEGGRGWGVTGGTMSSSDCHIHPALDATFIGTDNGELDSDLVIGLQSSRPASSILSHHYNVIL